MAISGGPDILTDGLQLHLDAADENSYSGSGSTWYDLAGNSRNGIIQGATYSSENNGSFIFNGSTSYIDCDNFVSTYDNFTNSTECFWFKCSNAISGPGPLLFLGGLYRPLGNFSSYWSNESITIYVYNNIEAAYTGGSNFFIDNVWHYACWCFGAGFNKIYVDGIDLNLTYRYGSSSSTVPLSMYTNATKFIIGRRTNDNYAFGGNISQVSIYDRALSASEILQNYNATKGRYGL
jgi:hypothetical protein